MTTEQDKAKLLLGNHYALHMAKLGGILQRTASETGKTVMQVANDVCEKRQLVGIDRVMIIAAAAELQGVRNVK